MTSSDILKDEQIDLNLKEKSKEEKRKEF